MQVTKVLKNGKSPIWLVEGYTEKGAFFTARFDAHKKWFIDRVPFEQSEAENLELLKDHFPE